MGITGPIGAGKTTLIQMALGLITPDSGAIHMLNLPLESHRQTLLQQINFASSSLRLNGYSSIMENLMTFSGLYNIDHAKEKIQKLSDEFHIRHLLDSGEKVYKLSSGENSTVNLCKALLNNPVLLFFDEITAHMDPSGIRRFYKYLRSFKRNSGSVVLISQNISELQYACDRIIFMRKGHITNVFSKNQFSKLTHIYD